MESTAFFETKVSLTPKDMNHLGTKSVEDILLGKVQAKLEKKCSSHGFVLPGTLKLISRSVGYFEAARFTGEAVYYVKAEGRVLYPADGVEVVGVVIRKNKMGMYVNYRDAVRIQIPRDLHLGNEEYEAVELGESVRVALKKSKFQVNDEFILATGIFLGREGADSGAVEEKEVEEEAAVESAGEEEEEEAAEESGGEEEEAEEESVAESAGEEEAAAEESAAEEETV